MKNSAGSKTNKDKVKGAGTSLKSKFVSGFNGLGAELGTVATNGVNGFIGGVLSRWAQTKTSNAAQTFGGWYANSLAGYLATHSPSKVTEKIAGYAVDGSVNRILNEQRRVQNAGLAMGGNFVGGLQMARLNSGSLGGGLGGSNQDVSSSSVTTIDNTKKPTINIYGDVHAESKGSVNQTLYQLQFLAGV
jgi:hypothetical protein